MTPAELYAIQYQNPQPSHFTMVPNIIDHLTYDELGEDGNITKKRLSIYAKELYRVLCKIAGESGACWMGRDHLAELCNMSAGKVSDAKKELLQKFNELNNNPLIVIFNCKKGKMDNGVQINSTIYHKIMINNIWQYNNAYMSTKKYTPKKEALSPHDSAGEALSPHDGALREALSPHDTNNNICIKNPLFKEQQPAAEGASVCSLHKKDSFCSLDSKDPKFKAFKWFIGIGCDEKTALQFVEKYSLEEITLSSEYVNQQIKKKIAKNESLPNKIGYMRKTLENKWWRKKTE